MTFYSSFAPFSFSGFFWLCSDLSYFKDDHSRQLCQFDDKKLPHAGDQEGETYADHFEEPALCLPYAPLVITTTTTFPMKETQVDHFQNPALCLIRTLMVFGPLIKYLLPPFLPIFVLLIKYLPMRICQTLLCFINIF